MNLKITFDNGNINMPAKKQIYTKKDQIGHILHRSDMYVGSTKNREVEDYVVVDEKYYRPTEVDQLLGDSSKAKNKLGWEPKVGVDELINMMADHDFDLAKRDYVIHVHDLKLNHVK